MRYSVIEPPRPRLDRHDDTYTILINCLAALMGGFGARKTLPADERRDRLELQARVVPSLRRPPFPTARSRSLPVGHPGVRRAVRRAPHRSTTGTPRGRRSRADGSSGRTWRGILARRAVRRRDAKRSPVPAWAGSAGSGYRTGHAFVSARCSMQLTSGGTARWALPAPRA